MYNLLCNFDHNFMVRWATCDKYRLKVQSRNQVNLDTKTFKFHRTQTFNCYVHGIKK